MAKATYLENAVINHFLRASTQLAPAAVYCGLFLGSTGSPPSDAGGGDEVDGNAYARQAVTFGAPAAGITKNSAQVTFPVATPAGWGTVSHFAIIDAATTGTGNYLYWGAFSTAKTVAVNDQLIISTSQLQITES
jgi:hypothetical protein